MVVVESFYHHYCLVFWVSLTESPFYRVEVAVLLSAPRPYPDGPAAEEVEWELLCHDSQTPVSAVVAQLSAPHLCPEMTAAQLEVEWELLCLPSAP